MPIHQQSHGFLFMLFTLKFFIVFEAYNAKAETLQVPCAARNLMSVLQPFVGCLFPKKVQEGWSLCQAKKYQLTKWTSSSSDILLLFLPAVSWFYRRLVWRSKMKFPAQGTVATAYLDQCWPLQIPNPVSLCLISMVRPSPWCPPLGLRQSLESPHYVDSG